MTPPDRYDDYLRHACGLNLLDGPPVALTLEQARAALLALAADADRYRLLLSAAIRHAKTTNPPAVVAALESLNPSA